MEPVSAARLGAGRRRKTLVAETLDAGRGVSKESPSGKHGADPLVVTVGRHTPQDCSDLSTVLLAFAHEKQLIVGRMSLRVERSLT